MRRWEIIHAQTYKQTHLCCIENHDGEYLETFRAWIRNTSAELAIMQACASSYEDRGLALQLFFAKWGNMMSPWLLSARPERHYMSAWHPLSRLMGSQPYIRSEPKYFDCNQLAINAAIDQILFKIGQRAPLSVTAQGGDTNNIVIRSDNSVVQQAIQYDTQLHEYVSHMLGGAWYFSPSHVIIPTATALPWMSAFAIMVR